MKKLVVLLFAVLCCIASATAQDHQRDSLWQAHLQAPNDTLKWKQLYRLSQLYESYDLDSALQYAQQALAFARERAPYRLPHSLDEVGLRHMGRGNYDQALESLLQAIEEAQRTGCKRCEPTILGHLGSLFDEKADWEKAESYYRQAIERYRALGDSTGVANQYNQLGLAYLGRDRLTEAENYLQHSLTLSRVQGLQRLEANLLNNLGNVYFTRQENTRALDFYRQAREAGERIEDTQPVILALLNSGWVHLNLKQYDLAVAFFLRAKDKAQAFHNDRFVSHSLGFLAKAYKGKGDYLQAYTWLEQYQELNDTLDARLNNRAVLELEAKYQTQQKEVQLARQQLELEQQSKAKWLFASVALVLLLVAGGLFQFFRQRQKIRQKEAALALQLEQAEAEKLRDLDRLKSNFFANISHEFRTPLTLILGPARQWMEQNGAGDQLNIPRRDLHVLHRNGERLLTLVNQMLDLARLESGRMQLHIAEGDVVQALRAMAYSFESMAGQKNIAYRVEVGAAPPAGWFDADKLEKIVNNLLSNALKHTAEGGEVVFQADFPGGKELHLQVNDTGSGIPPEEIDRIFDRFYQVEGTEDKGSGIGLALVKELVQLHHGQISVTSEPGAGSSFLVVLPIHPEAFRPEDVAAEPAMATAESTNGSSGTEAVMDIPFLPTVAAASSESPASLPLCLVVEDNADVRAYICQQLQGVFRILQAADGLAGLEVAREEMPDLVVSDIMMPGLNGTELCTALKTDERTSHIPVILLTAKADQASKLGGLEIGADDYLTKPFDARELLVRAQNLVQQRRLLRERFSRELFLQPRAVALTSADERFMQRVMEKVEAHLADEQFSVEELARQVGMSRSQLHRKLTALVDQSPVELIRNFRLRRAKEMLEAGTGSVSEICYEVGFNSPAYFSKSFKDAFGVSPSEVRE